MGRIEKKSYERYDFYDGSFRRAPAKPFRAAPRILAPLLVRLPAPCSCVVLIPIVDPIRYGTDGAPLLPTAHEVEVE